MDIRHNDQEEKRKKKGLIGSFIYTIVLIIALLFPLFSYQFPAPGMEGIRISFGEQNQGDGDVQPQGDPTPVSSAQEAQPTKTADTPQETAQTEPAKTEPAQPPEPIAEATKKTSPPSTPVKKQPDPPIKQKVATADNSKEIAAAEAKKKKQQEETKKKQQEAAENAEKAKKLADKKAQEVADKKAKEAAEKAKKLAAEEAKRKAAEAKAIAEAKRKAEEEKKFEDAKNKFGGLFGQNGSQGNSGKPGDAGVANGDPDAKNLEGTKSYGKGDKDVGGGLSGRGVLKRPSLEDNSQKEGKVKVEICVNKSGKVIKAEYSQFGSTTIDTDLIELAEASAKKYQFTPSINPEQCGDVLITFSLQ